MTDREEAAARISEATKRMARILGAVWVPNPWPRTDRKDGHE